MNFLSFISKVFQCYAVSHSVPSIIFGLLFPKRATKYTIQLYHIDLVGDKDMAKILAVDDSTSMRQMVSFTLKESGHDVVEASDGNGGLQAAKTQTFDLIITDVNMPGMDGITMCREIRALPAYKFTPILMLTTEAGMDKKMEGKSAGATGWLVKPFNPDKLLATVARVL